MSYDESPTYPDDAYDRWRQSKLDKKESTITRSLDELYAEYGDAPYWDIERLWENNIITWAEKDVLQKSSPDYQEMTKDLNNAIK